MLYLWPNSVIDSWVSVQRVAVTSWRLRVLQAGEPSKILWAVLAASGRSIFSSASWAGVASWQGSCRVRSIARGYGTPSEDSGAEGADGPEPGPAAPGGAGADGVVGAAPQAV